MLARGVGGGGGGGGGCCCGGCGRRLSHLRRRQPRQPAGPSLMPGKSPLDATAAASPVAGSSRPGPCREQPPSPPPTRSSLSAPFGGAWAAAASPSFASPAVRCLGGGRAPGGAALVPGSSAGDGARLGWGLRTLLLPVRGTRRRPVPARRKRGRGPRSARPDARRQREAGLPLGGRGGTASRLGAKRRRRRRRQRRSACVPAIWRL